MNLNIKDTFNKILPADPDKNNTRRQVHESAFSFVTPRNPSDPQLVHASEEVAELVGLSKADITTKSFLEAFSGRKVLEGTAPYAMCYGGHQFGNWAGQLGDGRAINLTEIIHEDKRWSLQLKGAGATPYSRNADGLAVLRSSVREHLCSEAMYHLGVPTSRSLSLMLTGDQVLRDMLYDGNSAYEKGAVVCRVAPSFVRFGSFQIFASRQEVETMQKLVDYTIETHFPDIKEKGVEGYLQFFSEVAQRTLDMVIHWQRVGFVHGVMNTDNMSIHGITIDYGPYGWLEGYDHGWTPNTTDRGAKRYRYGQQPQVALWNLFQLANALYPLINEVKPLESILERYKVNYQKQSLQMMKDKLGLVLSDEGDGNLIGRLQEVLHQTETDMTIFFRNLANVPRDMKIEENAEFLNPVKDAFYQPEELKGVVLEAWKKWFGLYLKRLQKEEQPDEERRVKMNKSNPKYVLRNYMAQLAIDAADKGDFSIVEELYSLLKMPYAEQKEAEKWFVKRPEWARHKVGCSMLSCSS